MRSILSMAGQRRRRKTSGALRISVASTLSFEAALCTLHGEKIDHSDFTSAGLIDLDERFFGDEGMRRSGHHHGLNLLPLSVHQEYPRANYLSHGF
jgi:hypothetical protein